MVFRPRLKVSRLGFVLLAATFLSLINGVSILQRAAEFFRASSVSHAAAQSVIEIVLLWCAMATLLLAMSFNRRVLKVWSLLLACAGVFASYYVARLNVGIDTEVIRSILSTDQQEVREFLDPLGLLLLILVGSASAAILVNTTIVSRNERPTVFAPHPVYVFSVVGVVILSTFGTVALGEYYAKQFFRAGLPRYSPANLVVYGIEYGRDAWRNRDIVVRDISLQFSLERVASRGSSEVVVIVIGESARVRNFQLAGYGRSTNPRLSRERDLIFFRDVTACRTHTVEAIPCLLTRLGAAELSIPVREVSLITILKRLGFDTKWLGMQGLGTRMQRRGNAVYRICQEAQLCKVSIKPNPYRDALDEDVLPSLRKSIAKRKQGRLLIVIHLLGSHAKYYARYPPEWAIYQPECKKAAFACGHDQVINSYDNSILYTDHVLGEAIELLRKEKAILFFTSDHGESLGELAIYGHGWPRVLAPEEQMKVPMAIWATPSFIADHQGEWARLHQAASRSTSHDYFFHTVLGCLGVQSPLLRSELNLCGQQEMAKR